MTRRRRRRRRGKKWSIWEESWSACAIWRFTAAHPRCAPGWSLLEEAFAAGERERKGERERERLFCTSNTRRETRTHTHTHACCERTTDLESQHSRGRSHAALSSSPRHRSPSPSRTVWRSIRAESFFGSTVWSRLIVASVLFCACVPERPLTHYCVDFWSEWEKNPFSCWEWRLNWRVVCGEDHRADLSAGKRKNKQTKIALWPRRVCGWS